ncbi:hypothetical protein ACFL6U_18565 [Planctomycetota bacterium]
MNTAWITVIIAAIIAYIAWQQHELAKDRFKLDLFDKRFAVYKGAQVLLTRISQKASSDIDMLFEFRKDTQDSAFLFDDSITEYLKTLDKIALELDCIISELQGELSSKDKSQKRKRKRELVKSAIEELPKLKDVFAPYLKFERWNET